MKVPPDLAVLDAVRGLSALYVMAGHAFVLLVAAAEPSAGGAPPVLATIGRAFFRWMHEAVLLFFIISGFCIHYRQASLLARPGAVEVRRIRSWFGVRSYGLRRFRRLFPPLALALAATALFDLIGGWVAPAGPLAPAAARYLADPSYAVMTLVGNLLFQPSFLVPPFGLNGPLWSLAFEFWFYALYPLMLLVLVRGGMRALVSIAAVLSIGAIALLPSSIAMPGSDLRAYQSGPAPWWIALVLLYWSVWVWGAMIAEAYARGWKAGDRTRLAAVIACAAALASLRIAPAVGVEVPWRVHDLLFGGVLALAVAFLMVDPPDRVRAATDALARRLALLGDMSYSLYVLHLPWLVLLSTVWISAYGRLPAGGELMAVGVVSSLVLSLAGWFFVERHFMASRSTRRARARAATAPPPVADGPNPVTVRIAEMDAAT